MVKRDVPIKTLRIKIVNVVLYPEDNQKIKNYIDYFKKIYVDKVTIKIIG